MHFPRTFIAALLGQAVVLIAWSQPRVDPSDSCARGAKPPVALAAEKHATAFSHGAGKNSAGLAGAGGADGQGDQLRWDPGAHLLQKTGRTYGPERSSWEYYDGPPIPAWWEATMARAEYPNCGLYGLTPQHEFYAYTEEWEQLRVIAILEKLGINDTTRNDVAPTPSQGYPTPPPEPTATPDASFPENDTYWNYWAGPTVNDVPLEYHDLFIQPKVYDIFLFNNELDVLEIRLNELDPVVDMFFIVDATLTHTLQRKESVITPELFEDPRFKPFKEKITHIQLETMEGEDTWARERWHRTQTYERAAKVVDMLPGDIIIVGDVDELPRGSVINRLKRCKGWSSPRTLRTLHFYYSYETRADFDWYFPAVFRHYPEGHAGHIDANWMNENVDRTIGGAIVNAGWHCSWCFATLDGFINKMVNYAHTEHNTPHFRDGRHIVSSVLHHRDLMDRGYLYYRDLRVPGPQGRRSPEGEVLMDMPSWIAITRPAHLSHLWDRYEWAHREGFDPEELMRSQHTEYMDFERAEWERVQREEAERNQAAEAEFQKQLQEMERQEQELAGDDGESGPVATMRDGDSISTELPSSQATEKTSEGSPQAVKAKKAAAGEKAHGKDEKRKQSSDKATTSHPVKPAEPASHSFSKNAQQPLAMPKRDGESKSGKGSGAKVPAADSPPKKSASSALKGPGAEEKRKHTDGKGKEAEKVTSKGSSSPRSGSGAGGQ